MTRTTKTLTTAIAVLTAGTLISATAVVAAPRKPRTGTATQDVDRQDIAWRTGKANRIVTTAKTWTVMPMPSGGCNAQGECVSSSFEGLLIPAKGEISLTFSGNFSKAPVQVRVRDGRRLMRPGAANFDPRPGSRSFSFTYVSDRRAERVCDEVTFQWRSPTGGQVRLNNATVVVHYKKFAPDETLACL